MTKRMPRYISGSTTQAVLVVTPLGAAAQAPVTVACTSTCNGSLTAPVGLNSVSITLEDVAGKALSQGSTTAIVNQGTATQLRATLDGIVHSVAIVFAAPIVPYAPQQPYSYASQGVQTVSTFLSVNALDADGNVITYNGGYIDKNLNNLAISLSTASFCAGGSCGVKLGATTISGPGAIIPVQATLDDKVAGTSQALGVIPSVLFGDSTIGLTSGATTFVRPSSCTFYAPQGVRAGTAALAGNGLFSLTSLVGNGGPLIGAIDSRVHWGYEFTFAVQSDFGTSPFTPSGFVKDLSNTYPNDAGATATMSQGANGIDTLAFSPFAQGGNVTFQLGYWGDDPSVPAGNTPPLCNDTPQSPSFSDAMSTLSTVIN